jgi:hypothetical protein
MSSVDFAMPDFCSLVPVGSAGPIFALRHLRGGCPSLRFLVGAMLLTQPLSIQAICV